MSRGGAVAAGAGPLTRPALPNAARQSPQARPGGRWQAREGGDGAAAPRERPRLLLGGGSGSRASRKARGGSASPPALPVAWVSSALKACWPTERPAGHPVPPAARPLAWPALVYPASSTPRESVGSASSQELARLIVNSTSFLMLSQT